MRVNPGGVMKLHILAVDADPEARSVYRILFARECLTVAASADAVPLAARFDVVITDSVRALRELCGIGPAVRMIHADGPLDVMEAAYMVGFCDWLFEKPSWFDLHHQIRELAPKSPMEFRPRTARRAKLSLNMFLHVANWSAPRRLQTVDISERGLGFLCTEPLAPGETIHIALALPRGARLRLLAVVRHSTPISNGSKAPWLVGAEIRELATGERRTLRTVLENCRLQ